MTIEELENKCNNLNEENIEDFLVEIGNTVETTCGKENIEKEDLIVMSKLLLIFSQTCKKMAKIYEKWEKEGLR